MLRVLVDGTIPSIYIYLSMYWFNGLLPFPYYTSKILFYCLPINMFIRSNAFIFLELAIWYCNLVLGLLVGLNSGLYMSIMAPLISLNISGLSLVYFCKFLMSKWRLLRGYYDNGESFSNISYWCLPSSCCSLFEG